MLSGTSEVKSPSAQVMEHVPSATWMRAFFRLFEAFTLKTQWKLTIPLISLVHTP